MNDSQLLERLAATDAYAPGAPLPSSARTRNAAIAEIERRADMQTQKRTVPPTPPRRTRDGWLVAAAAFAVVLLLGVAMAFWASQGNEDVIEPTTTTSAVSTTITTVPPPPEPVPPMVDTWQRVGAGVMTPVVGLFDMTQVEQRLVAVGFDPGEDDMRQNGVIFASDDGVNWVRLAEDDPALTLGAVLMYGVTGGGPGLVVVGTGCEDDAEPCMPYPTVWTSSDGIAWDRSPASPDVFGESGAMLDVVRTEHGLVAAGGFYTARDDVELIQPSVWLSPDGVQWERVWQGEAYDYTTASAITGFQALATSADGRVVGVGTAVNDQGEFVGAIWTSTDGRTWERIDQNSGAFASGTDSDVSILDVASGPGGFVAVGSDGGTDVAIWHSPDGYVWTRVDTATQAFNSTGTISSVAALDKGYVAAGPHGFADQRGGWVTLWTSVDGATWDRVHAIGDGYAMAIVAADAGIAVAGGMAGADNFHAAVWVGPPFDPEAPPPDPEPPLPSESALGDSATGIAALEEGFTCEEIAAQEFTYAETVAYWARYGMPADLDPDDIGMPCEDEYSASDITDVFGEPEAMAVHIVSALPEDPEGRIFVNTGPAVDSGLVCPTGTTEFVSDGDSERDGALFRWEDRFTCADGSGTFILGTDVFAEIGGTEYGIWNIVSGTGAYESLAGGGGGRTGPGDSVAWADDLVGRLASGTE